MNTNFFFRLKNILFALLIIISNSCFASPIEFIESLKNQINNASSQQKEQAYQMLKEIVRDNVDTKQIGKFVMSKHWNLATEREKEEFIREYGKYLERLYAKNLYKFIGNEIIIMSNKDLGNANYLVGTRFRDHNDESISVNYKITKSGDSFRIVDVIINGISIAISHRAKFDSDIQEKGLKSTIATLEQFNINNDL